MNLLAFNSYKLIVLIIDNIGLFIKLPEFPFIICKVYRYAYTREQV
jgi:hypothetical protein